MAEIETLLRRLGLARAADLQAALGLSQPTVSRALTTLGERVVRVGRARAARYALAESLGTHGSRWPLFTIDPEGQATRAGQLVLLSGDRVLFQMDGATPVFLEGTDVAPGLFPALPWFIEDLRPQGFLGRVFAHAHGPRLGAPADVALWNNRHVLSALLTEGDDLIGDLVLGEAMLAKAQGARLAETEALEERHRARRYSALASLVLAGEPVGSSAGGEQPKFTSRVRAAEGRVRHVLVKFTDAADTPVRARWMDLMLAEHHAAEALHAHGVAAARSEIVSGGDRLFLEVVRFDRHGAHGRSGCVTLAALDDALYGARDDWRRSSARLARDGWLTPEDARMTTVLHWFGGLIANTDMHFGNLSFRRGARRPLALAPVYDMLPMQYRPAASGELVARAYAPPPPPPNEATEWGAAARAAADFWTRVVADDRVTASFRAIASANRDTLARATREFSPAPGPRS